MKAYVILRKGFEYDDNIYHEYEGGGGSPDMIVFSKEDAIRKVEEMNIEEFPTFIIYKAGKPVWQKQGLVEKEVFIQQL